MRLNCALFRSTIVWVLFPLLIVQGCTATTSPRLTDQLRARLGTIGVVSASPIPEAHVPEAKTKAEAKTAGAMKGLGLGLGLAALCPLALATLQFGGAELLGACLLSLGTPFYMVSGAAEGGKAWIPEAVEEQGKAVLNDALNQGQLQQGLKNHFTNAGRDEAHHRFVLLEEDVAKVVDEQTDYRHLTSRGIDTVLEVGLLSIGFIKADSEEPSTTAEQVNESKEDKDKNLSFSLSMVAHARLIGVRDNVELSANTYNFTSREHKWSEWVVGEECPTNEHCRVKAGQAFDEAIGDGHRILAQQIVDAVYTATPSPHGTDTLPIARIAHRAFDPETIKGLGAPEVKVRLATAFETAELESWNRAVIVTSVKKIDFENKLRASVERRLLKEHQAENGNGRSRLEIVIERYGFANGPEGYILPGLRPDKRFCSALRADITLKVGDQVRYKDRIIWESYKRSTGVPPPRCGSGNVLAEEEGKLAGQIIDESAEVLGAIIVSRFKGKS